MEIERIDYPEEIAKKQFSKLQSDLAVKLLNAVSEKANTLRGVISVYSRNMGLLLKKLLELGILRTLDYRDVGERFFRYALGVDSSRQRPLKILDRYYAPITTAIAIVDFDENSIVYDYGRAPIELFEVRDPSSDRALQAVENRMFRLEVEALNGTINLLRSVFKNHQDKVIIVIDGPLIDPPEKEPYDDYLIERAEAVKECQKSSRMVLGCIKRPEGTHFTNFLKSVSVLENEPFSSLLEMFTSDAELLPVLFSKTSSLGDCAVFTQAIEINQPISLVNKFTQHAECRGIYRTYVSFKGGKLPVGIDFIVYDEAQNIGSYTLEIVKLVFHMCLPGSNVPLPVLAAHQGCNIKRGAAEYLYRTILTRAFSTSESLELMGVAEGV